LGVEVGHLYHKMVCEAK